MAGRVRPRVSYTSASISYPEASSTTPRPDTRLSSNGRPPTGRPRTAASTLGSRDQQVICAISESRGISPVVGLAFVNLTTTEAVLCQISDNQTFTRTIHKLVVYEPTELLFMTTAAQPKSKLFNIVESNVSDLRITVIDRKYWSETTGLEYIQHLAFKQDVEAIKVSVGGNFYATCCIAAVLKYIELALSFSFPFHSLRIKYETSEGSMMIDLSTISSMELIQNLQNPKSKDCLFGLLNQTLTPMGSRLLKSLLLQPSTNVETLEKRFDALDELATREDIFFAVRQALKAFLDVDRILTAITIIPTKPTIQYWEQSINNVIALKQYVNSIPAVFEALTTVKSELLLHINELCAPERMADVQNLIDEAINEDITYQSQPLDLRNQRTYAIKACQIGPPGSQTYKEANADAYQLVTDLGQTHSIALEMKYDTARQYYIRIATSELEDRNLPEIFINSFRKKNFVECQTLDLLKLNQKIADSHHEVLQMSDASVQELVDRIREDIAPLFKTCEAIALLDMIASFAQLVTVQEYCRPELTDTLAIKSGRHPIREKIHTEKFVPNDAYATQQSRFQIITGCNMSGKSTYIRSLALMTVMAQIGCFVPAAYASFPIRHQMFARISTDDSIEANVSTFASEMRETAFILRNIDKRSMVIVDELGRGTSTRDGLTIAIAIAEALIESRALVWFATHFRELAHILSERSGVVNLHLAVDMSEAKDKMTMLYKITNGWVQETHYGIAMAKVAGLPADVIRTAEEVSSTLARNIERQKKNSKTIALAKRRKLILGLREQLKQAQDGNMQGRVLGMWLSKLQDEFVRRMAAIDEEVERLEDEEILDNGRESLDPEESLAAEIQDIGREVRDHENKMMEDRSSSEDTDGLVQDIPGASRVRRGLYKMSGALPVE
ncbi:MAG: hypothetical protein L6R36_009256 [Xanthoria steineri]|nr:MAG: hypothetical protein L6R36_009256 [Xanthoria steineri]